MMPPIAVAIPIYLMYRELGLSDTALGMILLVHGRERVRLPSGCSRASSTRSRASTRKPRMIDGYTRLQAFFRSVLPQASDGHRRHRRSSA